MKSSAGYGKNKTKQNNEMKLIAATITFSTMFQMMMGIMLVAHSSGHGYRYVYGNMEVN